jgi:hypothetical protein
MENTKEKIKDMENRKTCFNTVKGESSENGEDAKFKGARLKTFQNR